MFLWYLFSFDKNQLGLIPSPNNLNKYSTTNPTFDLEVSLYRAHQDLKPVTLRVTL